MEKTMAAEDGPRGTQGVETLRIMYERRAVRRFTKKAVSRELIGQVIGAGRMAPSAMNGQPWRFYVLTDTDTIHVFSKEIAEVGLKGIVRSGVKRVLKTAVGLLRFTHGFDFHALKDPVFYGAPVVIFLTAPVGNEWAALDIGMCAQNMMLAAKSLGLDSCPVGFGKYVEKTAVFSRLHVPSGERVLLSVILGYGDEQPEPQERVKGNVFFIE